MDEGHDELVIAVPVDDAMPWRDVASACLEIELANPGRRITKVWCDQPGLPDLYEGHNANAPVERGPAAIRWNDGQIETLAQIAGS